MQAKVVVMAAAVAGAVLAGGCSDDGAAGGQDVADLGGADAADADDADAADADDADAGPDADTGPVLAEPVADPEAAARAFRLYYRERVHRAATAYNRYALFGGAGWGLTNGQAYVATEGDGEVELVVDPNENNAIGLSVWTTWEAWRVFRSRPLALTLVRMFEGLVFYEAVTGHAGVTSRTALPGWTRVMDGLEGEVVRTRFGEPVAGPWEPDPALEAEVLDTFFDGVRMTYRENPAETWFSFMPGFHPGYYSVTWSQSELPRYLRRSECCTSIVRTPDDRPWGGAFWANHNSRDNLPDLTLGFVAARAAAADPDVPADVRAAAQRAVEAGERIGDLVWEHGGRIMTVGEHTPYDELVVSGGLRPDGTSEIEDLGSLSDCATAYASRAISSDGLALPAPELPLPGSLEFVLVDTLGAAVDCEVVEPVRTCDSLMAAYCGLGWDEMEDLQMFGEPWLELVAELEADDPGKGQELIGSFQDDAYEKTMGMASVALYADATGDEALRVEARAALRAMADLLRTFADIVYTQLWPERLAFRRYEAALLEAWAGLEVDPAHLHDLSYAEAQMARHEGLLDLGPAEPRALLTDEEIAAQVEDQLSKRPAVVRERYEATYPDGPPVRRAGEAYEARGNPLDAHPWRSVEPYRHHHVGALKPFQALPLCRTAPHLLDCTWAALGCERPDLDGDGGVDADDRAAFEAAREAQTTGCGEADGWCGGADLDRTGSVDATDAAFMEAAQGCVR